MSGLGTTPVSRVTARRFRVEEFDRMIAAGILAEDERVELLHGVIVEMTPIGDAHNGCVNRLTWLPTSRLGTRAVVQVQGPIRVRPEDDSRPEPDLAVLRPREDFYQRARAGPAEIVLIIEVADTSSQTDRLVKLPLYARAEIAEVWVVDLPADLVLVARDASPGGIYATHLERRRGTMLAVPGFPDVTLAVGEILGSLGSP